MVTNSSFCWQIYAINKRTYEAARQILVIKVTAGDLRRITVKLKSVVTTEEILTCMTAVTHRGDAALSGWVLHRAEGDWEGAALFCSGWDKAGLTEAVGHRGAGNSQYHQRPRPRRQGPPSSCGTLWRVNRETWDGVSFSSEVTLCSRESDLCQCVCEGGVGAVFLRLSPEGDDTGAWEAVQNWGQSQGPRRVQLLQHSQQLYHLVQDGAGEAWKYKQRVILYEIIL